MIWTCDLHSASSHESHQMQLLKEGFKAAEVLDVSEDDTDESKQWEDINNNAEEAEENESGDENNNLDTSFQSSISNKSNRLMVSSNKSIKKRVRKSK